MPWDAASFHKHNRGLTAAQSGHAARIANAVLKRSGNEGMAIAVANRDMKRAAGGSVDRRNTKNEDWTDRLPPAQGTIDPWMLMNIPDDMPEASVYTPDLHPDIEGKSEPLKRQPPSYAFGGMAPGLSNDPTLHPHMFASVRPAAGFLNGATPGRADALHTKTRGGSYVFPADVVAAAGQGNSIAGAHALQGLLSTGPYGVPLPNGGKGKGMGMPARTAPRFPGPRRLSDE